jgi:hypothetical protein
MAYLADDTADPLQPVNCAFWLRCRICLFPVLRTSSLCRVAALCRCARTFWRTSSLSLQETLCPPVVVCTSLAILFASCAESREVLQLRQVTIFASVSCSSLSMRTNRTLDAMRVLIMACMATIGEAFVCRGDHVFARFFVALLPVWRINRLKPCFCLVRTDYLPFCSGRCGAHGGERHSEHLQHAYGGWPVGSHQLCCLLGAARAIVWHGLVVC